MARAFEQTSSAAARLRQVIAWIENNNVTRGDVKSRDGNMAAAGVMREDEVLEYSIQTPRQVREWAGSIAG
jgi:hypothetical protein